MSEAMPEKQQYLEGPWQRVSGPEPLNQFVLDGWKENLNNMYGEANWQAVPVKDKPDHFHITASPDYNSVYAAMARKYDREGKSDNPLIQSILADQALKEHGTAGPETPKTDNRTAEKEQDRTDPTGKDPDFSNPATI